MKGYQWSNDVSYLANATGSSSNDCYNQQCNLFVDGDCPAPAFIFAVEGKKKWVRLWMWGCR